MMDKPWDPKRRRFLETAVAAGVAGGAIACGGRGSPWRVLTETEGLTAAAICELLIPRDAFPDASAAGAVDFIDRQLDGYLRKYRPDYAAGLAAFEQAAQARSGKAFAEIDPAARMELLRAAEKRKDPFFALILTHTMESYYGDPRHGGNRDEAGYRSIGLPATIVRGRSHHDLQNPGGA